MGGLESAEQTANFRQRCFRRSQTLFEGGRGLCNLGDEERDLLHSSLVGHGMERGGAGGARGGRVWVGASFAESAVGAVVRSGGRYGEDRHDGRGPVSRGDSVSAVRATSGGSRWRCGDTRSKTEETAEGDPKYIRQSYIHANECGAYLRRGIQRETEWGSPPRGGGTIYMRGSEQVRVWAMRMWRRHRDVSGAVRVAWGNVQTLTGRMARRNGGHKRGGGGPERSAVARSLRRSRRPRRRGFGGHVS